MNFVDYTKIISKKKLVELVYPYVVGDGQNFEIVRLIHEKPTLIIGGVYGTKAGDVFIVQAVQVKEDFFDDMYIAICKLMTNNSNTIVSPEIRTIMYMYSAAPSE